MGHGQVPQRRLGLDLHEVLVVVDLEEGLGRVGDLPDDDGGDLDGIAVAVVDLELGRLEVAHADADPAPPGEGVDPVEPLGADGAGVAAEEDEDAGLVRVDRGQAGEHHEDGHEEDYQDRQRGPFDQPHVRTGLADVSHEGGQHHSKGDGRHEQDEEGRDARQ